MKDCKELLKPYPLFALLKRLADRHQVPTYVVGGFVRDALQQRISSDIDIVCVGDSMKIVRELAHELTGAKVAEFKRFGSIGVSWRHLRIEFVNARKESYARDSRKPTVSAGTLKDDIFRRDFTINALAIALHGEQMGELIDLCGGVKDLQQKIIRTPLSPERTFDDDPLRMFRAVRFAIVLDFKLLPATLAAIQQEAHRIAILSKERIIEEVNKILRSADPARGLALLDKTGLLVRFLPELEALKKKETILGHSHKDNFHHTLQVVRNLAKALEGKEHPRHLWLIWAGLLHDIAKPLTKRFDPVAGFSFHEHEHIGAKMVPRLFRRLGLPMKREMRYVQQLVRMHLRHIPLVENDVSDAALRRYIFDAGDIREDLLMLCRADVTSGNPKKVERCMANFDQLTLKLEEIEQKDRIRNMKLAVDGKAIMEVLHLKPSKEVGLIKEALKEAILAGEVPNKNPEAYNYILKYAKKLGLQPTAP